MKLELKHYLDAFKYKVPCRLSSIGVFNLDLEYPNDDCKGDGIITEISTNGVYLRGTISLKNGCAFDFDFKLDEEPEIELIYRPLSYLTKEIEHNGETFVPIEIIKKRWGYEDFEYQEYSNYAHWFKLEGNNPAILHLPYCFIELFLEWHFDIYGLIKNGLAIEKQ